MLTRKIQPKLLEGHTLPRWKLSYLASELYHQQDKKELHARIWKVLHHSGLHPLTQIPEQRLSQEDWEELKGVWREMYLNTLTRRQKLQFLDKEDKEKQKRLTSKNSRA